MTLVDRALGWRVPRVLAWFLIAVSLVIWTLVGIHHVHQVENRLRVHPVVVCQIPPCVEVT